MQPPRASFFVPVRQCRHPKEVQGCSLPDLRSKPALRRVCPLTKTRGGRVEHLGTKISKKRTPRRLPRFWHIYTHFIFISYTSHHIDLFQHWLSCLPWHEWANTLELTLDKQDALQTICLKLIGNGSYGKQWIFHESLNYFVPGHILVYFAGIFQ